ncbi:MAG: UDP-glucose 4-epimerase GalE [Pseudobdellovibrionaceae bacterium]
MKILVTGGAGYIGSCVVRNLLPQHEVVVYDNLSTGFKQAIPESVRFVLGDVRDKILLSRILKDYKIEAVLHFAAKMVVPDSITDPASYYDNNTMGVLSLTEACRQNNINKIVFSSTAAVYGNAVTDGSLISEKVRPEPLNPYGWSKWMSEQILQDAQTAYGIRSVCLRYFNVAGAHLEWSCGARQPNATHLIKVAAQAALGQRKNVEIFGTDYPTKDGTCIRDFIHLQDLAVAHVLALDYLVQGQASEILNCGYGQGSSVRDVLTTMQKVSNVPFVAAPRARRPGDPVCVLADNTKIKSLLNWQPKYNDLEYICKTAFEWEKGL